MLTPQQRATLKAAIMADTDPDVVAAVSNGADNALAALYNLTASPAFTVWRTSLSRSEVQDDDVFNWTVVDNLSTGSKYRIWEWMFNGGSINPSKPNIRAGIAATWVGNAQLLAVQTMVLAKCKRSASKAEKLFAVAGPVGEPATMTFEGQLSTDDVSNAMRS